MTRYSKTLKYADDIRIYQAGGRSSQDIQSLETHVQKDIDALSKRIADSGMSFNHSKCFSASFGVRDTPPSYHINGNRIPCKTAFRDLGVSIQVPLKFNNHIDIVASKAARKLGLINKLFKFKSKDNILRLFCSLVRPYLEYSSIVWSPYTIRNIRKIEKLQKKMCRMIPSISNMSYSVQLSSLGLLSLQSRRTYIQLTFLYKLYNGLLRADFDSFFSRCLRAAARGHDRRIIPKHSKRDFRLNFFTVSIIPLWNELPKDIIHASSLNQFKSRLRSFLIQKENS